MCFECRNCRQKGTFELSLTQRNAEPENGVK